MASHEPPFTWRNQKAEWSDLALKLKLSEFHFNGGRLTLKCIAQIAGIYYREAELELESARRPIPQRGRCGGSFFLGGSYESNLFLENINFVLFYRKKQLKVFTLN